MEEKMQVAYEKENFQWALKLAEALLDTKNKVSAAKVKLKKKHVYWKWYFVSKIVLIYCEKKNVLVIEKNF